MADGSYARFLEVFWKAKPDETESAGRGTACPDGAEPLCRIGVEVLKHGFGSHKLGAQIMSARAICQAVAVLYSLVMVGVVSPAHALTQQELIAKLESAGYSQIRDIKSTAEGTAVKATKNGKEVSLDVDSSGQIKERQ